MHGSLAHQQARAARTREAMSLTRLGHGFRRNRFSRGRGGGDWNIQQRPLPDIPRSAAAAAAAATDFGARDGKVETAHQSTGEPLYNEVETPAEGEVGRQGIVNVKPVCSSSAEHIYATIRDGDLTDLGGLDRGRDAEREEGGGEEEGRGEEKGAEEGGGGKQKATSPEKEEEKEEDEEKEGRGGGEEEGGRGEEEGPEEGRGGKQKATSPEEEEEKEEDEEKGEGGRRGRAKQNAAGDSHVENIPELKVHTTSGSPTGSDTISPYALAALIHSSIQHRSFMEVGGDQVHVHCVQEQTDHCVEAMRALSWCGAPFSKLLSGSLGAEAGSLGPRRCVSYDGASVGSFEVNSTVSVCGFEGQAPAGSYSAHSQNSGYLSPQIHCGKHHIASVNYLPGSSEATYYTKGGSDGTSWCSFATDSSVSFSGFDRQTPAGFQSAYSQSVYMSPKIHCGEQRIASKSKSKSSEATHPTGISEDTQTKATDSRSFFSVISVDSDHEYEEYDLSIASSHVQQNCNDNSTLRHTQTQNPGARSSKGCEQRRGARNLMQNSLPILIAALIFSIAIATLILVSQGLHSDDDDGELRIPSCGTMGLCQLTDGDTSSDTTSSLPQPSESNPSLHSPVALPHVGISVE